MKHKNQFRIIFFIFNFLLSTVCCFAQWHQSNSTITGKIRCFAVNGNTVFAGSESGVFLSNDNGENWTLVKSGIDVLSLATKDTLVFAGTDGDGVFRSTDSGITWGSINFNLGSNKSISALTMGGFGGSYIFAGAWDGVYRSSKSIIDWSVFIDGLPLSPSVNTLVSTASTVFAGTEVGLFSAPIYGSWTLKDNGLTSSSINTLVIKGSSIYAGTSEGLFRSTNNGSNWKMYNIGLPGGGISVITANGSNIFTFANSKVYRSINNGISWALANNGLLDETNILSLAVCGPNVIAGTKNSGIWIRPLWEMSDVEETNECNAFSISPNPVTDKINIEISDDFYAKTPQSKSTFEIINLMSQTVLSSEIEDQKTIDINVFPSGFYFLKLNTGKGTFIKRFVKQ